MKIENVFEWEETIRDECNHPNDEEEIVSGMEKVMLVKVDDMVKLIQEQLEHYNKEYMGSFSTHQTPLNNILKKIKVIKNEPI